MDERPEVKQLLETIKASLQQLEGLRDKTAAEYEDRVYRLYHQSYKVYWLQGSTQKIVEALRALAPDRPLDEWFVGIVEEGTGKTFEPAHNQRWLEVTRPIVEAFFHARYMLEMAIKYGKELDAPPAMMPSGWAALLYLYALR